MKTKVCSTCKEEKPITEFHKCKANNDGLQNNCKACSNSHNRAYFKSEKGAAAIKRYREKYPKKERARVIFNNAKRHGKVKAGEACFDCGTTNGTIEHHHPDYSKPLETVPLCKLCHKKRHRKDKRK